MLKKQPTLILLTALLLITGCSKGQQTISAADNPNINQDTFLPTAWTPTKTPTSTMIPTPTETQMPSPTATATSTPVGFLRERRFEAPLEIAWSSDGFRISLLSREGLSLHDALSLEYISISKAEFSLRSLNFSPDGNYIAACGRPAYKTNDPYQYLLVWDGIDGRKIQEVELEISTCPARFINNEDLILYENSPSINQQNYIHIWRVGSGIISSNGIDSILFNNWLLDYGNDGKSVAYLVEERYLHSEARWWIWLMYSGDYYVRSGFLITWSGSAHFSPDNLYLYVQDDKCSFSIYRIIDESLTRRFSWCDSADLAELRVVRTTTHPNGEYVALGYEKGRITIWNSKTGEIVKSISVPNTSIIDIAFNPVKEELAILSASSSGSSGYGFISLWSYAD